MAGSEFDRRLVLQAPGAAEAGTDDEAGPVCTLTLSGTLARPVVITADGTQADTLFALCSACPELATALPAGLAEICLHLYGRGEYVQIVHTEEYRERYAALLQIPAEHDNAPLTAADFPVYDTSGMAVAAISAGQLVFYAESALHGVPCCVEVEWPPAAVDSAVRFLLLPVVE